MLAPFALKVPLAHFRQEVGSHDDKEKVPAGHIMQVDRDSAPTAMEKVPEEQGAQAWMSLMYVPATHADEHDGDPAAE